MKLSWNTQTDRLACRWSEVGKWVPYDADWMKDAPNPPSGYLPPVPDFASHSPFSGPDWFELDLPERKLKAES